MTAMQSWFRVVLGTWRNRVVELRHEPGSLGKPSAVWLRKTGAPCSACGRESQTRKIAIHHSPSFMRILEEISPKSIQRQCDVFFWYSFWIPLSCFAATLRSPWYSWFHMQCVHVENSFEWQIRFWFDGFLFFKKMACTRCVQGALLSLLCASLPALVCECLANTAIYHRWWCFLNPL